MKIKNYEVVWREFGWSYAIPLVYKKSKLFGFITHWKKIWKGRAISSAVAEKMLPQEMKQWFEEAVSEYEKYTKEWSQFKQ